MGAQQRMHTMSGPDIRDFLAYLQRQMTYTLSDLLRDNQAWQRDAAVALIEYEALRRGIAVAPTAPELADAIIPQNDSPLDRSRWEPIDRRSGTRSSSRLRFSIAR